MAKETLALLVGPMAKSDRFHRGVIRTLKRGDRSLFVVGVDSGARQARALGLKPDLLVGDWDSLGAKSKLLESTRHITLPREKDRSDLYHAVIAAWNRGVDEVICLGVTSGRPDHHLAAMMDLAELSAQLPIRVLAPEAEYVFVSGRKWRGSLKPRQCVSIFAVLGEARGLTLRGFKYRLEGRVLTPSSHGLSNEVSRGGVEVEAESGALLVILPCRAPKSG